MRNRVGRCVVVGLGLLATAHCSTPIDEKPAAMDAGGAADAGRDSAVVSRVDAGIDVDAYVMDGAVAIDADMIDAPEAVDAPPPFDAGDDAPDAYVAQMDAYAPDAPAPVDAATGPSITSFTAAASACAGASVDLDYAFSGGTGTITPGNISVSPGTGHVTVTLAATTSYTLTVTNGGVPATATASVTAIAAPVATITAPANARHGDVITASVPTQSSVTYAWSVLSSNATITAGAATHQATVSVTAGGAPVKLQVVVTSTANSCATTATAQVAVPCGDPSLVSLDRSVTPAVPQYVANNENTRPFDINASGDIWTAYPVHKASSGFAIYDAGFSHSASGVWGAPASSPLILNAATSQIDSYKVATDTAGDAVYVWTEYNGSGVTAQLRAYNAAAGVWSAAQTVGSNALDQATPVFVSMNRSTGVAMVAWTQGPNGAVVPHVRSYTVSTGVLGADIALRATTTNVLSADMMDLGFETNDSLTGFVSWFETDSVTSTTSLFALHVTSGTPDTSGTAYAVTKLVQGTKNSTTDILNSGSAANDSPEGELRRITVSAGGNAAVMWSVYNGLSTSANQGQLYALRYTSGAWGTTPELVDSKPSSNAWYQLDWAIDDAGNMIAASVGSTQFGFTHALAGASWSSMSTLAANSSSSLPYVAMDSTSGRGVVTYIDTSSGTRGALMAAFYDGTSHALGSPYVVDDPTQGTSQSGRVRIDSTGRATIAFVQTPKPPPSGTTSANNSLEYIVSCQ